MDVETLPVSGSSEAPITSQISGKSNIPEEAQHPYSSSVIDSTTGSVSRDPKNINDEVKVSFEDVFAEPEGFHSFDAIWDTSDLIFSNTKLWCYRILSAICALPCALLWGISFSCFAFCTVWYYTPLVRKIRLYLKPWADIWRICIKALYDPCYESIGRIFSGINVSVSKYKISSN